MADNIGQVRLRVLPSVSLKEGGADKTRPDPRAVPPASESAIKVALTTNSETVNTLRRLAGVEAAGARQDVEKANLDASKVKLKDVKSFTDKLAEEVRSLDSEGVDALFKDLPDGVGFAVSSFLTSKN